MNGLVQRILLCCALLMMAATAQADAINFNGGMNALIEKNCKLSEKIYTCDSMPSGTWNDTIAIADSYSVNITGGGFTLDYNKGFRMSGTASLTAKGNLDFSNFNRSIVSITGGFLTAQGGTLSMQAATIVAEINAAAVILASDVKLTGSITTSGALQAGSRTEIVGRVNAYSVVLDSDCKVNDSVTSSTTINLRSRTVIIGALKGATINFDSGVKVTGDITASTFLSVASGSTVTGNITGGKVEVLSANAYVSGNIDATGSVLIDNSARVGGNVTSTSGTVTMGDSNARIDGNLTAVDIYLNYGYIIGKNLLAYSVTAKELNNGRVLGTSTCEVGVRYVCNGGGGGASTTFDAVEVGAAAAAAIFTKLSGTAFTLDLLALTSAGTINTSATDTVTVSLVDQGSVTTNACTSTMIGQLTPLTFVAADKGRKTVSFTVATAVRNARVKISRSAGTAVTVCSADNFAIRPAKLNLTMTNATTNPLAAASGMFTVAAQAASIANEAVTNYNGTPAIGSNPITLVSPAGGAVGSLARSLTAATSLPAANATSGIASAADFTYSEVGSFQFNAWSVYDDGSFANVDKAKNPSECFADNKLGTANAPGDPNVLNSGKYGCYFGNSSSGSSGNTIRFIPHHFDASDVVMKRTAVAACTPLAFAYMGEPMQLTFKLTAKNGANVTTTNYAADIANFKASTSTPSSGVLNLGALATSTTAPLRTVFPICGNSPCIQLPDVATGVFVSGIAGTVVLPFRVLRPAAAAGPYPSFHIGIAPEDADGVKMATTALDIDTGLAASANNHVRLITTSLRWGQMKINNNYGSGMRNFPVTMQAQYYPGTLPLITNTLDNCTPLVYTNFDVDDPGKVITTALYPNNSTLARTTVLTMRNGVSSGMGNGFMLSKPNPMPTKKGSVVLSGRADAPFNSYLPGGSGTLTFGIARPGPIIFMRELY